MKNSITEQYFTPDIEDIRVGYECEWGEKQFIFEGYDFATFKSELELGNIRVPYLTKQQIETEGWTPAIESENCIQWYRDDRNLTLKMYDGLGPLKNKIVLRIWHEVTHGNQLFLGECRCINDFRLIMKFLGIK